VLVIATGNGMPDQQKTINLGRLPTGATWYKTHC
jgi:hypothetical protein